MTFDVGQLPGRAATLKKAAIDMTVQMYTEAASMGGGAPPVSMYQDWAEKEFAHVDSIYDDFVGCPSPDDFTLTITNFGGAMDTLATTGFTKDPVSGVTQMGSANTKLTAVGSTGDAMGDWTGDAADAYNTNYADKFVPITSNLFTLTSVTRSAVEAEAAVWATTRADLDKLSSDAITKVNQCMDKSPSDWSMALTVAGAVASIVAVPFTGGGSAALAFAAVGAGISIAGGAVSAASGGSNPGPKDISDMLETGSPDKVVDSLYKALNELRKLIDQKETQISNTTSKAATEVNNSFNTFFCLPRPNIADAEHHPYNDPKYLGSSKV